MANRQASGIRTIRYYTSVAAIYAATLLTMFQLLQVHFRPVFIPLGDAAFALSQPSGPSNSLLLFNRPDVLAGTPTRLVIPRLGIDIQVIDGTYNPKNGTWSLTRQNAHFATITAPA